MTLSINQLPEMFCVNITPAIKPLNSDG